jgi:hypothetical protein
VAVFRWRRGIFARPNAAHGTNTQLSQGYVRAFSACAGIVPKRHNGKNSKAKETTNNSIRRSYGMGEVLLLALSAKEVEK